jgi:hypothetical protein
MLHKATNMNVLVYMLLTGGKNDLLIFCVYKVGFSNLGASF